MSSIKVLELFWDNDKKLVRDYTEVPSWVDQNLRLGELAGIIHGGCRGFEEYAPANAYSMVSRTMATHGDKVIAFLLGYRGDNKTLPFPTGATTWSEITHFYLREAAQAWAESVCDEVAGRLEANSRRGG